MCITTTSITYSYYYRIIVELLRYTDMVAYANGYVRHFTRHVAHDRNGDPKREPANRGCTVGPLGLGFNRLSVL